MLPNGLELAWQALGDILTIQLSFKYFSSFDIALFLYFQLICLLFSHDE